MYYTHSPMKYITLVKCFLNILRYVKCQLLEKIFFLKSVDR